MTDTSETAGAARALQQALRIGLARAGRGPAALGAPLDALLPAGDGATPEAALWLSLAVVDAWERSGFAPMPAPASVPGTPDAVAASPAERLRPCPARAEALLAMLLRGVFPADLLGPWLRELARHGGRVPPRFLPTLLDTATRQADLRPALLPVLGERGRWLAQTDREWQWAALDGSAAPDPAWWETGSFEQRAAALHAWRARDPGGAREALADTWRSEPPEARAALLAVLAQGLGPDDEAFLETALDDKRKEVRAAARSLLAGLPGSQFVARMTARLQAVLQLEGSAQTGRLQVALPAECDAAMRRDGVGAGAHPGFGEKTGWVIDMLAAVDPCIWSQRFGAAPRACLALARGGDAGNELVRGWGLAAIRHRTPDWVRDFATWWLAAPPGLRNAVPDGVFDVHAALFHDDRDGTLSALLDALPANWLDEDAATRLLLRLTAGAPESWPAAPSRRMVQHLAAVLPAAANVSHVWLLKALLDRLARVLDPSVAAALDAGGAPDDQWRGTLDKFFDIVRFRHETVLSFQEQA